MSLEEALRAQEEQVDDLLKAANKYVGTLKTWKKSCQTGHIGNHAKGHDAGEEIAPALAAPAVEAAQDWTFDVRDYLESGEWRRELQATAGEKFEPARTGRGRNARLVARCDPRAAGTRRAANRQSELACRCVPSVVAAELKRLRDRAQSANSQEFLDGLLAAATRLNKELPPEPTRHLLEIPRHLRSVQHHAGLEKRQPARRVRAGHLRPAPLRHTRDAQRAQVRDRVPVRQCQRARRVQRDRRRWPRHPLLRHSFSLIDQL